MNREEARRNFVNVALGKRRRASLELEEAKARLRRADEDLDISTSLHYLGKGDLKSSLYALAPVAIKQFRQADTTEQLLARALPLLSMLFAQRRGGRSHRDQQQKTANMA